MNRKLAREMAMKLIFQMDMQNDFSHTIITKYLKDLPDDEHQIIYIQNIANAFTDNHIFIDQKIEENVKEWKLNRIAKVDLAILRLAITEIFYFEDIPNSVSINEAVEMAKTYGTEESSKFINGILGTIMEKK
ncbi:transcription antitermination factor NusB [Clostridiaceae bacterium 35-E11]